MIYTDDLVREELEKIANTGKEIVNVRIDAFTATSSITGDRLKSKVFISQLTRTVDDMYYAFESSQPLTFKGARGWVKGSLRHLIMRNRAKPENVDWVLMSVTGEHSEEVFKLAVSYEEDFKVTRLDVAVDIAFHTPKPDFLKVVYAKNRAFDDTLRLIAGASGDTLYKNSRKGKKFGRVYDKSSAYNLTIGSVYRFEIESKSPQSDKLAEYLKSGDLKKNMLDYAVKTFKNWAIPIPANGDSIVMPKISVIVSDDVRKLEWVAHISGAIRGLCQRGYENQVRELLNLPVQGELPKVENNDSLLDNLNKLPI